MTCPGRGGSHLATFPSTLFVCHGRPESAAIGGEGDAGETEGSGLDIERLGNKYKCYQETYLVQIQI